MSVGGFEQGELLREAIKGHSNRKGCTFRPDAVEWLKSRPSWDAFMLDFESAQIECHEEVA